MYIINIKYMKFFKVILEKNSYVPYNHKNSNKTQFLYSIQEKCL